MSPSFRSLIVVLAMIGAGAAQAAPAHVKIESGALLGDSDGGVMAFKGVPYAEPPVGLLRWRGPRPAKTWTGERKALDFGHACIQGTPLPNVVDDSAAATPSEDCLTLNVWAPAKHDRPAPVMVWIHGGGNTAGSSADAYYDGAAFARDGVVLVSINYRLGLLGFFAHPALTAEAGTEPTGDFGLMDQVAALAWVKNNIAAFGGDPANVTVFGESAGGQDVVLLLTAPSARGLFQKAVSESAGRWTGLADLTHAEAAGRDVAAKAGIAGAATAAQLRAIPAKTLLDLGERLEGGPMVDGRFLPEQPAAVFAAGRAVDVPLVIGTNGNEGSLLGNRPRDPAAAYPAFKAQLDRLRAAYGDQAKDSGDFARLIFRDQFFSAPARFVAQKQSPRAPVYLYRFDYVLSLLRARREGASHASEIPFVFETWPAARISTKDKAMTQAMHGCWTSFAKTGAPTCPGAPAWPAYAPTTDQWMEFGADGVIGPQPVANPRILDALAARETRVR